MTSRLRVRTLYRAPLYIVWIKRNLRKYLGRWSRCSIVTVAFSRAPTPSEKGHISDNERTAAERVNNVKAGSDEDSVIYTPDQPTDLLFKIEERWISFLYRGCGL